MRGDFAAEYEALDQWHWWFHGRRQILRRVLAGETRRNAGNGGDGAGRPARTIASLGSGPASGMRWLHEYAGDGGTVIGVDADPTGVLRTGAPDPGAPRLVIGTLELPPLRRGSCDIVLILDCLEHIEDDVGGLAAAAALLRPGGSMIVTVPALPGLWGNQDIVAQHYRRYTASSLRGVFGRAGLNRPAVTYFNTVLFPAIAAIRCMRRVTGRIDGGRSDFEGSRPGLVNTILAGLFGFERHLIGRVPLPVGVSLLAVYRRG